MRAIHGTVWVGVLLACLPAARGITERPGMVPDEVAKQEPADTPTDTPYIYSARLTNLAGTVDVDANGSYEIFRFDIELDADVIGSARVAARVICTTTGQAWTVNPWTLNGTAADWTGITLSQEDFAGRIDGETSLDFTVELWDAGWTTRFDTETRVSGEPFAAEDPATASTPSIWGARIRNLVDTTDVDADGYYETFGFEVEVDADVDGTARVAARVICTTTGQSWTLPAWDIRNRTSDWVGITLFESDFAGKVSGNTSLDFVVELWDAEFSRRYDTCEDVANEPVFVDPAAAPAGTTEGPKALLVGIDRYAPSYGQVPLPSCVNDAEGFRDVVLLGDPDGRWQGGNITLLTNNRATRSAIRTQLQSMAAGSRSGDLFVYFQSSHGGQAFGASTHVCTYDGDYTDEQLGEDLARFDPQSTVVVVVDACHAGGLFKASAWSFAERARQAAVRTRQAQFLAKGLAAPKDAGSNIAFMVAADYDEYSLAGDVYSLYAGYLIEACSTAAADSNGDGQLQFLELHEYAAERSLRQNPEQTAQSLHEELLRVTVVRSSDNAKGTRPFGPCGAGGSEQIPLFGVLLAAGLLVTRRLLTRDE